MRFIFTSLSSLASRGVVKFRGEVIRNPMVILHIEASSWEPNLLLVYSSSSRKNTGAHIFFSWKIMCQSIGRTIENDADSSVSIALVASCNSNSYVSCSCDILLIVHFFALIKAHRSQAKITESLWLSLHSVNRQITTTLIQSYEPQNELFLWTEWKLIMIVNINLIEAQGSQSPITLEVQATQQLTVGVRYCHHNPPPPALRSASEAGHIHTRSFNWIRRF